MSTRKKHKKYTEEFKRETLELLTKQDKTIIELEQDLGLAKGTINRWKRELMNNGEAAFPGQGKIRPIDEEILRLKKENLQLKQERDLLKKAVGIVSRDD